MSHTGTRRSHLGRAEGVRLTCEIRAIHAVEITSGASFSLSLSLSHTHTHTPINFLVSNVYIHTRIISQCCYDLIFYCFVLFIIID